jgi:hypothetical protein
LARRRLSAAHRCARPSTNRRRLFGAPRAHGALFRFGLYELTAISHIGPALAYLAQVKANGDARWKGRLESLRTHVAQVRALNQPTSDNWLEPLNQPAWRAHMRQICDMVDYACARTLDYIGSLGSFDHLVGAGEQHRWNG